MGLGLERNKTNNLKRQVNIVEESTLDVVLLEPNLNGPDEVVTMVDANQCYLVGDSNETGERLNVMRNTLNNVQLRDGKKMKFVTKNIFWPTACKILLLSVYKIMRWYFIF